MRIGIVTFWDSQDNYGQLLQCFASQHYLRSLGHDAFLIKYKAVSHYVPDRSLRTVLKKLISPSHIRFIYNKITRYFSHTKELNINRHFDDFRNNFIDATERIYTEDELRQDPPKCDILITGSDQVWAGVPLDPIYFLQFGEKRARRVALSASFGRKSLPETLMHDLRNYLKCFDAITVREQSGIELCKLAGRNDAQLICDPTLLCPANVYLDIAQGDIARDKVFIYYLGHKSCITDKQLIDFLGETSYDFCGSQGLDNNINKVYPSIPEWLGAIRNANLVITNSFHGTVFSLLFRKQFVVVPLVNSGANDRIETLLGQLHLKNRVCSNIDQLSTVVLSSIDYSKVSSRIEEIRDYGRSLLDSIIDFR